MSRVLMPLLLVLGLSMCSMGCVYQGRLSIRRVWADLNTLNEPALYYEQIDHFPNRAVEVDHFRWMYNKGPNPRVPYQVIPEGVLEKVYDTRVEVPARDCPDCITPDAVPLRGLPGDIEDRFPPVPGQPSQNRKEMQPKSAEANRSGNNGSFRPVSKYGKSVRPSMTSNQPIGLLSDEEQEDERSSLLNRVSRWWLGEKNETLRR